MHVSLTRAFVLSLLILAPFDAVAQTAAPQPGAAPQPAAPSQQLMKSEELDALLAPVALYSDPLLALVMMASTYPLEVVQADRWVSQNSGLKGDQLKAAVDKQPWDESVRSLAATPAVLNMMSTKLDWTQRLGDAVLAQQTDVMDAVQRLRSRAQANKQLSSNKQQTVSVSTVKSSQGQPRQVIAIAPTEPNTIHVPYYNPSVVYGAWPYPAYPPYYYPPPAYIGAGLLATGVAFGAGYALGRWASGGNYWGGNVNWNNNNINVNRPVNVNNPGNNFQHRPEHRHGVRYNNPGVQQKFGGNRPAGSQARTDFRGHSGQPGSPSKAGQQPQAGKGQQAKGGKGGSRAGPAGEGRRREGSANQGRNGRTRSADQSRHGRSGLRRPGPEDPDLPHVRRGQRAIPRSEMWARAGRQVITPRAGRRVLDAVAAVADAVVAAAGAAAVAADGGPMSHSSTTSSCSAIWTTASASIASHTMAAKLPMSVSWRRKCNS